jgi:4-hydroxy-tetrahydrodipicolinate reductase
MPARVAVAGATGRMGRMLISALLSASDMTLSGALAQSGSKHLGEDAGAPLGQISGIAIGANRNHVLAASDLLIDFTTPEATLANLAFCVAKKIPMVIGTTGFDSAGKAAIDAAGRTIGIVFAPNMSIGVNVALALIDLAARSLPESYDAEIVEMHHRDKRDAPSGSALQMGEVIAHARNARLEDVAEMPRHGLGKRSPRSIGIASLRGGDVIGDHSVIFAGPGERLEITHRSSSRATYAEGSLVAARFLLANRERSGVFDMRAVLGIARP